MELRYFLIFIAPALGFSTLLYYGIFWNLAISFTDYSILSQSLSIEWFKGFIDIASDSAFISSFKRTMIWAALLVLAGNVLGLLIASIIFQVESLRLRNMLTALFMYPIALSMVVIAIAWRWLFDHVKGINVILSALGLQPIPWLLGDNAFWSLIFVSIWVYAGFISMLYLAMFYNIDKSLIESAMVDGAGALQIMTRVVIPNAKQGLIVATVFLMLFAIQMFDLPYSMLFYNPFTETMVIYVHRKFVAQYYYLAASAAVVIIVASAFIVIPYAMLGIKKWILKR